jgi:hypothetical protein
MLTIPASKLVSADLIMLKPMHQAQQWLTTPIQCIMFSRITDGIRVFWMPEAMA